MAIKILKELRKTVEATHSGGLLIPLINQWRIKNGSIDPDVASAEFILSVIKKAQLHPRDVTMFHPSSAYACLRAQLLAVFGNTGIEDIDTKRDEIFDDGKWRHIKWQTIFFRMGILKTVEHAEVKIIHPKWYMTGGADAIVEIDNKLILVEIKGANSNTYTRCSRSRKPVEGHLWQALCYTMALREMGVPIYCAVVFYENKDNQELQEFVIRLEDFQTEIDKLSKRYGKLNKFRKLGKLTSFECKLHDKDRKFLYCRQSRSCVKAMRRGQFPKTAKNIAIIKESQVYQERKQEVRLVKG